MKILLIVCGILVCCVAVYFLLFYKNKRSAVKKLSVGDAAPSFTLPDETGVQRSLSDFLGKKVVLYFYPKDGTPGCTTEACGLRDSFDQFKQHDIVVLGVSYDSVESHKNFKDKERLPFMLLSDSDHDVAHLYGTDQHAMGSLYASRKTFLIDEQGIIKAILENVTPETHANDVLKVFGFNA